MMSRLEEIKGMVKSWLAWNDWNDAQINTLKDILTYLERVQELEGIIYKDERQAVLEALYEDNQRYKQALDEIYIHAINFSYIEDLDMKNYDLFEFASRVSFTAQKALEGESE